MFLFNIFQKNKFALLSFALLVGLIIGLTLTARFNIDTKTQSADFDYTSGSQANVFEDNSFENAVINVAERIGKAVVSISSESVQQRKYSKRYSAPFSEGPFEDDFFNKFFDDFLGQLPDREFKSIGLGSGVIIDANGYILTNEHVVKNADKLTVKLSDGREFKAVLKGSDSRSDLAVIKIDANNLPTAVLGDSRELKIGQWVVAVGNPFGFALQNPEPTVTAGVVSALHRSLGRAFGREKDYSDLIQTDAAINPGNSGGPLVNLKGEIIGINVAIFSTSGGYEGIGFAIPINNAKRIVSKLIKGEEVVYGWLGITIQNIDEKLTTYMKLDSAEGVLVVNVLEDGPAKEAGMKSSDVILEFDNNRIKDTRDLLKVVGESVVGNKAKIVVMRDGRRTTLQVKIGQRPSEEKLASGRVDSGDIKERWRGLAVEGLNESLRRRYKIEERNGVVVVDVEPASLADDAGIVVGDIIVELNKNEVSNIVDFNRIKENVKGDCLVRTSRGYFVISSK
ncbi:MAG: Do family serine endopeptidase [Candidatus Omnitrophica bacterium]|nr:Do family serine endopeptidase [Candidatus Omnitrophota bacterium]